MKKILKNSAVQSLIASLLCIVLGLLIGYIVLLIINPDGAWNSIVEVMKNFLHSPRRARQLRSLGTTLVRTAPLLMCALSVLFAYKVGLFNIGAAGQYVVGSCASLYAALAWHWGWFLCLLFAIVVGGLYGALVGFLKANFNVNEVISGIMLNWIGLYTTNMILANVKESTSPYTLHVTKEAPQALLPSLGLGKFFNDNPYVTIAIPLAVIAAIAVNIVLDRTRFGYELKATGNNKNAAKYAGMAERRNIILTLIISGGLAAMGGAMLYLTDLEQWSVPIGTIFASYFIQHITDGGTNVDLNLYCAQISDLISAIIIYLCGFVLFIKQMINKSIARQEEREAQKAHAAANKEGGEK